MTQRKTSKDFLLAPGVTVSQYQAWLDLKPPNRTQIANMIRRRFESRFIEPVLRDGRVQGGFAAVALCCLGIQALDCFRTGHNESVTAGALKRFIVSNAEFVSLRGKEREFYENIRNGLLHQAETRGGWRIRISGPLFDRDLKIIGAQALLDAFAKALHRHCDEIENSSDSSEVWIRLVEKMGHVVKTCDDELGAT